MVGRNANCPCGSGEKFKDCCLPLIRSAMTTFRNVIEAIDVNIPLEAKQWVALGILRSKSGQYNQAIKAFQKALQIYPHCATVWVSLGLAQAELGDNQNAEQSFRKSVEIEPDSSRAFGYLGGFLIKVKKEEEALLHLNKAILLNPNNPIALNMLAVLYHNRKEQDLAIEYLEKTLAINPNDAYSWLFLCENYIFKKNTNLAIEAAKKALDLDPTLEMARVLLGLAYEESSQYQTAEETYNQVLTNDPQNFQALGCLGILYFRQQEWEKALDCYRKANSVNSRNEDLHFNIGSVLLKLKRLEDAELSFKTALVIDPNFAKAWSFLALVLSKNSKRDESLDACRMALKLAPTSPDLLNDIGNVFAYLGEFDESEKVLLSALEIQSGVDETWNNLGITRSQRGHHKEALDAFERAYNINPKRPIYALNIGLISFSEGDLPKSKKYLLEGLSLLNKTPPSQEELIYWTFSVLHNFQEMPDIVFLELSPYFHTALVACVEFYKAGKKNRTEYEIPSPLKMVIKWHGWQIVAQVRKLPGLKSGEFPSGEIESIFEVLFRAIEDYKEYSLDQAPTCKTFWSFIRRVLQLHKLNMTSARNEFSRALQDFDHDLAILPKEDGVRKIFQDLKDHLNDVNLLVKDNDVNSFAQELERINEIISNYIKACLDAEFPFPLLAMILKPAFEHEHAFLEKRRGFLEMLPLESQVNRTLVESPFRVNIIRPFRERILIAVTTCLNSLESLSGTQAMRATFGKRTKEEYFRDEIGLYFYGAEMSVSNANLATDIESPNKKGGESDIHIRDRGTAEQVTISTKIWKRNFDENPPIDQLLDDMGSSETFGILVMFNYNKGPIEEVLKNELIHAHRFYTKDTMKSEKIPDSEKEVLTASYNYHGQTKQVYFFIFNMENLRIKRPNTQKSGKKSVQKTRG